jgi:hypothetical protein
LKYDLVEQGIDLEYFHAAEDKQATRNRVFEIIRRHLDGVRVDALLVEKCKTAPALRVEEKFYAHMLGQLLQFILGQHHLEDYVEIIVFTDRLPVQRKRGAVEKAVKQTLASILPAGTRYRVLHHDSKSNFDLQIADYCTWAVYRKWALNDSRAFEVIAPPWSGKNGIIFRLKPPPFTDCYPSEKATAPATLAREPHGFLSPGRNL